MYSLAASDPFPRERIAVIVPGMWHKTSEAPYQTVAGYYRARGITPVFLDINWKRVHPGNLGTSISPIADEIRKKYPGSGVCLFGFSFGAVIAHKLSETLNPDHILLCSMSPVFKEDREHQIFPFRQLQALLSESVPYAKSGSRPLCFLYGDNDSFLINRKIIARRRSSFPQSSTIIVKNAGHELGADYLNAVKKVISEIP